MGYSFTDLRAEGCCHSPNALFSHMLVYTPCSRRRNAFGALCARRRCAVITLCTPRARRERSVTTQSIAGQNSVRARWHAVGAPGKCHYRRGRTVTSPRYGKCKILHYIFFSIFVQSHGALRNFKSPCQRHGIAVECDRGYRKGALLFLAAIKQLYEWFSPSVCLSVCLSVRHTFLAMFPSSYHHEIFRSCYQWQMWRPCKRSRSGVKGQGHRGQQPT